MKTYEEVLNSVNELNDNISKVLDDIYEWIYQQMVDRGLRKIDNINKLEFFSGYEEDGYEEIIQGVTLYATDKDGYPAIPTSLCRVELDSLGGINFVGADIYDPGIEYDIEEVSYTEMTYIMGNLKGIFDALDNGKLMPTMIE